MFNRKQFSEDVFKYRSTNELTRKELGRIANVHFASIQGIENQEYDPRTSTFLKLCKILKVEPFNYLKL